MPSLQCWSFEPEKRPNFVQIQQRIQKILDVLLAGRAATMAPGFRTMQHSFQLQSQAFFDLEPSAEEVAREEADVRCSSYTYMVSQLLHIFPD